MWFTRAVVVSFAGAVALIGVGLIRAGRAFRKSSSEKRDPDTAMTMSSLETTGLGLFVIGLIGVVVDLAG
ncbi:MAG: hypothetical protein PVJ28_05055 [Acidimicrobiia bacterium]